jgi:Holliday junction resolvase RusA-like endonuclease
MAKKIILNVTPQTWVRVTQRDRIFFIIPFDKLYETGKKRRLRIDKYNDYKVSLLAAAKEKRFSIPHQGLGISFFISCPKTWSKKKKKEYHGRLHQTTPDLKNLLQAFEDSLCMQDMYIGHYSWLSKQWVDFPTGWIELSVSEPTFGEVNMPSLEGSGHL